MSEPQDTCICFDFGGVLVEILHTWDEILKTVEIEKSQTFGRLADCPILDRFQEGVTTYGEYLRELAEKLEIKTEEAHKVHEGIILREYPHAFKQIKALRKQGFSLGVLSNTNKPHIKHVFNDGAFPLVHFIQHFVTSYEAGFNKPEPEIYEYFQECADFPPEKIIFFDDAPKNVEGAKQAGWTAYLIDPKGNPQEQIAQKLKDHNLIQ